MSSCDGTSTRRTPHHPSRQASRELEALRPQPAEYTPKVSKSKPTVQVEGPLHSSDLLPSRFSHLPLSLLLSLSFLVLHSVQQTALSHLLASVSVPIPLLPFSCSPHFPTLLPQPHYTPSPIHTPFRNPILRHGPHVQRLPQRQTHLRLRHVQDASLQPRGHTEQELPRSARESLPLRSSRQHYRVGP